MVVAGVVVFFYANPDFRSAKKSNRALQTKNQTKNQNPAGECTKPSRPKIRITTVRSPVVGITGLRWLTAISERTTARKKQFGIAKRNCTGTSECNHWYRYSYVLLYRTVFSGRCTFTANSERTKSSGPEHWASYTQKCFNISIAVSVKTHHHNMSVGQAFNSAGTDHGQPASPLKLPLKLLLKLSCC